MNRFNVLGVEVSDTNLSETCGYIEAWIAQRRKGYVCVAPVSTIVAAADDPRYRRVVNNAEIVTPDGMPLVWLGKARGSRMIARTYGPDLLLALCGYGLKRRFTHFFFGSTPEVCGRLADNLKKKFPGIGIAGILAPPFGAFTEEQNRRMVDVINKASPDILWVGLGSPRQDFWMAENRSALEAPVMIGVGAAFDFLSGEKRQAPCWMQRSGLEWLFRLMSEPRRLGKRYIVGNTKFLCLLARSAARSAFHRS